MSFSKKNIINFEFVFLTYIFFVDYIFSTGDLKLSDYCLPGRLLAGKSAAKKLKKICFFCLTYIFWRAGHWKIGGKKNRKNICFFKKKLIKNRRQKKLKKMCFF